MEYYKILNEKYYDFGDYRLCSIRKQDIQKIRNWRNEQIDVLRQENIISKEEQEIYYNDIIKKSFTEENPSLILFSFLLNKKLIGYGGITNIDWKAKKSELSFLLDSNRINDKRSYEKDFTVFLNLIFNIVFNELDFKIIFTETYDIRPNHIIVLEKNGFTLERRKKDQKRIKGSLVDVLIHSYKSNV